MPLKTPGKLNSPPSQKEFDNLPLSKWCIFREGVFYRLHSMDRRSGKPWAPLHFGKAGRTRFDPEAGPGTFYVGETLAGVLLEVFDDLWGPVNTPSRSLTTTQLREWWITLAAVPRLLLFNAQKSNLSKIGTDLQLLAGDHETSREWALALARHPLRIDGIYYPSRHDSGRFNLAIFNQRSWKPEQFDAGLAGGASSYEGRAIEPDAPIVCGPPILLRDHPELDLALDELEVALLP